MNREYPDQWFNAKPDRASGPGSPRKAPAAKLIAGGQLVLNHAASAMLGDPDRVLVRFNPGQKAIRLTPTTPGDSGGLALSGGGNAQCRISVRKLVRDYPLLVGDYQVSKAANGVLLTWQDEE